MTCRRATNGGEPGGNRTRDQRIKSPLLYQLSYRLAHRCATRWHCATEATRWHNGVDAPGPADGRVRRRGRGQPQERALAGKADERFRDRVHGRQAAPEQERASLTKSIIQ